MNRGEIEIRRLLTAIACTLGASSVMAQLGFDDVSIPAGMEHHGESFGASWGDFNGDGYPDLFVNNHRTWASLLRNNRDGTFTDVILTADGSGNWKGKPGQDNHGFSWADFDGDDDEDLYATISAGTGRGRLLVNQGGIFFDRAATYDIDANGSARQPIWLDYDRDGDLDMAFMVLRSSSMLYKRDSGSTIDFDRDYNSGLNCTGMDYGQLSDLNGDDAAELICANGAFPRKVYDLTRYPFRDITTILPVVTRSTDSAIADFDGDLDTDVFVISGRKHPAGVALRDATSLEASIPVEPDETGSLSFETTGVITVSIDADRDINDSASIYIGAGGKHPSTMPFTLDPADPTVVGIYGGASQSGGVFIGYDPATGKWQVLAGAADGDSAGAYLAVSSTAPISNPVIPTLDPEDLPRRPSLLVNNGGTFVEEASSRGLNDPVLCVGLAAGDFDNDMDVDVYAVCRSGVQNLPNRLYENLGNGTFAPVPGPHGAEGVTGFHLADKAGLGDSAVTADYDLDGCMDLFVVNGLPLRPLRHDSGPDQLFRNRCNHGNHWIELDLRGSGAGWSNPNGIGATVYVTAGGKTQMREQNGGYHRWSQDHQRLHFGLGSNTTIDQIRVVWPKGGSSLFTAVAADGIYRVREQSTTLEPVIAGGGVEFPAARPGNQCGTPKFDPKRHAAVFLFQDCSTGEWSVRATAGWSTANVIYQGSLMSDRPLVSLAPYKMEGADKLESGVPGQVVYRMGMSTGAVDGFDFKLESGAEACLHLEQPANAMLLVGPGSLPASFPLNLSTFGTCTEPSSVSVDDVTVGEGAAAATFTVKLTAPGSSEVRVNYATADGTARDGADYTAASGTLVLPAGTTSGEIQVPLRNDDLAEGPETFTLNLLQAENARLVDPQGIATIADDEANACDVPKFVAGSERGLFLWHDCPDGGWHLRVSAGGPDKVRYLGEVRAQSPFPSAPVPFSLESNDWIDATTDPLAIGYSLTVASSARDGFDFVTPATGLTCFRVTAPTDAQLFVGAAKTLVGNDLDLATMRPCEPQP